ncbi:arginase [Pyrinomonas methylaliphatogenes]|jgi:arginase|uniref:Arginase n=1 Tax=Pyrinomonas methylaliphatogenes TaxID=454194 RepID=A0A0B6WVN0_9BACT|nr:arginase [Pyrinomonas methylaliphatogenes]MBX5480062.1 arginase [Pyrinomonas methylaliphatogenes]CDM65343.1 arginase [Pyrinomonas methylaliphatogenes]
MSTERNKRVAILGVPLNFGGSMAGVELGPAALRLARLQQRIRGLGYEVLDLGDLRIEHPNYVAAADDRAKYLREISAVCEEVAAEVRSILRAGQFPIILGGDHSIAAGSVAGVASFFHEQDKPLGLIWLDAHADMNTPETTPTGNVHGMPLAALFGYGARELTHVAGYAPKIDPRYCAHVGARDVDPGERELIRRLGVRFFTMREIDERGMSACMDEALRIVSQAPAGYHVTLDVDVLDPNDAPGSGTVVRGGLTYREAHLAMEKIAEAGGMQALEVVEINTVLDVNNKTAELGVELILSALGKTIL